MKGRQPAAQRSKFVVLNEDDEEFISVKQYLSSCLLQQGKVEEVKMVKIDSTDLTHRFDKKAQKMLKLVGWSNVKNLSGDNSDLSLLGSRGFVLGKGTSGLEFHVGNINGLKASHKYDNGNKNSLMEPLHEPEHTFIYSDVAIGRSFVSDSECQTTPIPTGYDSFYIPGEKLDRNGDGEFDLFEYQQAASFDSRDPAEYEHKYFVKDMAQVLPRYIIKFKFQVEGDKARSASVSGGSTEQAADSLGRGKQANTLDDFSHFDPETHKPVTLRQKMKQGGAKLLIPIEVAYDQALEDWKRDDPLMEGKKVWLENQLDVIDERVRDVNLNYADILEQINETAAAATRELQHITKTKLDTLLSVEIEIRRQKEQMLWMEGLVSKNFSQVSKQLEAAHAITHAFHTEEDDSEAGTEYKPEELRKATLDVVAGQLEFLQIWKHHTSFRNAASRLKPRAHLEAFNAIKPDIAIKTDLQVYADVNAARGPTGANTPSHNIDVVNARQNVVPSDSDKTQLKNALSSLQKETNYSQPTRPSRDLVSHLLQSVVDVEAGRIHEALNVALANDVVPLPASLHRPPTAGKLYTPTQLLDLLTPSHANDSAIETVNHKELYYSSMKKTLGHAPIGAKELHKPKREHQHHHHHHRKETAEASSANDHAPANKEREAVPPRGLKGDHREAKKAQAQAQEQAQEQRIQVDMGFKSEHAQSERDDRDRLQQQQQLQEQQMFQMQQAQKDQQQLLVQQQKMKQQAMLEKEQREQKEKQKIARANPFAKKVLNSRTSDSRSESVASAAAPFGTGPAGLTGSQFSQMKAVPISSNASAVPMGDDNSGIFRGNQPNVQAVQFSQETLYMLAKKFHSGFSLHSNGLRRIAQLRTEVSRNDATRAIEELSLSELLDLEDAQMLYYSLPFFSKPPQCRILYSSAEYNGDGSNVRMEDLYTKCMMSDSPSLLIIKSGEFVFGAYLSHPIRVTGSGWSGSPSCFIYSTTLDLKFPYHARNPPVKSQAMMDKPVAFKAERDKLTIGNGDIIIYEGGLCESRMENCYGVGLTYGSSEANCILAGTNEFAIDELEVWTVE